MKTYLRTTNKAPTGYRERILIQDQASLHLTAHVVFGNHSIHVGGILVVGSDALQRNRCFELTPPSLSENAIEYPAHRVSGLLQIPLSLSVIWFDSWVWRSSKRKVFMIFCGIPSAVVTP